MNLRTREDFTIPIFYLPRTRKLICRHYKSRKIEKNQMNGIVFFLQNFFVYISTGNSKRKYREASIKWELFHQISVVDRQITVRGVLNEGKGFFSKFILVKRLSEAYQKSGVN